MKEIKLVTVHNPFDRADRDDRKIQVQDGATLADIIRDYAPDTEGEESAVAWSINGHLADTDKAEEIKLSDGDCVVCVPSVRGGGDSKNPLSILAGIVLAVVAPWAGGLVASSLGLVGTMATVVSGLITGGIMMLGGQMISNLFYSDTSGLGVPESERETSYSWGSLSNAVGQGGTFGQTYGTVRTAGTLISQHIRNVVKSDGSSDSYLDLLYCGGEGPVDFLGNVEINGSPLESYSDATVQYRYGTNTQEALTNFNEVVIDAFPGINLEMPSSNAYNIEVNRQIQNIGGSVSYNISVGAGATMQVTLSFPNRLRYRSYGSDSGRRHWYSSWATIRVDYKLTTQAEWNVLFNGRISTADITSRDYPYNYGIPGSIVASSGGTYQIRVTVTGAERANTYVDTIFQRIYYMPAPSSWAQFATEGDAGSIIEATVTFNSGLYHVSDQGTPEATWVRLVGQYRRTDETEWQSFFITTISANQRTQFSRTWRKEVTPGRYFVRVGLSSVAGTSTRYVNMASFSQLSHIIPETLTRPGKVLVALSIRATDQISGGMPTVTWEQRRSKVYVKDGDSWVQKSAQNPAWICYDMAVQAKDIDGVITVFGDDPSRIDLAAFKGWAAWNDRVLDNRPAIKLNLYVDEMAELWEWFSRIGASGRGGIVLKGTKISCIWDEPSDMVQVFGMGNIVKDSFSGEYLGTGDRANSIEVSFVDAEKKYERRQITCYGKSYNEETKITNANSIFLYGVTDYTTAYKEGMYRLRQNEYIFRTVSIRASVDAIACQAGDVVGISHDVPQWGQSGRLSPESTAEKLTLYEPVTMEAGQNYLIAVSIATEEYTGLAEREVEGLAETGTATELTLKTPLPVVPQPYANYQFGVAGKIVKPFRVKSIERTADLEVTLNCIEYIAEIYTEETNIPDAGYSTGYDIIVADVRLREDGYKDSGGTHVILLHGTWKWLSERPMKFDVQYQINGGDWIAARSQINAGYDIPDPQIGNSYLLRVRPYDSLGVAREWAYSASVTVSGKVDSLPPDISPFTAAQSGDRIITSGQYPDIPDLKYIEIRRDGSAWENAMLIGRYSHFPAEFLANLVNDGAHAIRAKLVDNNGQESQNDAVFLLTVININRDKNIILERDDCELEDGTLENLMWANGTLYGGGATYDELYGDDGVYNDTDEYLDVTSLGSSYLSPVIDTFKNSLTGVMFDFSWEVYMHSDVTYSDISDYTYEELGDYSTYDALRVRGDIYIEIRLSPDNVTWSEWQEFLPGQYLFRYIQYRLTFTRYLQNSVVKVTKLLQMYDVPDLDIRDTVAVPAEGLTINFVEDYATDFYATPREYAAYPDVNGVFADIDIDEEEMTITCYNAEGEAVACNCRIDIHGY